MNIHTEHLEDHTARFTVEIEPERLDKAKRKAARNISKKIRIPGFRKGKVPYNVLVQFGYEANIVNDAIDDLTQVIYKETLEQAEDIEPYGPGNLEDVKMEDDDKPVFIYTVPLQPTVDLNKYRDIRVEYTAPEVTDEMVDEAMKRLQEQEALVEESQHPVVIGNRITVDINSEFVDDPPEVETATDDDDSDADSDDVEASADDNDEDVAEAPKLGDPFIHEHDAVLNLDPENEPILPGFIDAMLGAKVIVVENDDTDDDNDNEEEHGHVHGAGYESISFELSIPTDDPDYERYESIAGRKIKFDIVLKKVETVTLPELNDEFAAQVTKDEEEPLTLLQLRMRMRENLETEAENRAKSEYGREVLDKMVEEATIHYPEAMIHAQAEEMVKELDRNLQQQGMSLDMYTKVTGQSIEDIQANYREPAIQSIERSMVMRGVLEAEDVTISERAIEARIDLVASSYGEQAALYRSIFESPAMRSNIADDLLNQKITDVVIAIGKGEDPASVLAEPEADSEEIVAEVSADDVSSEATDAVDSEADDSEESDEVVDNPDETSEESSDDANDGESEDEVAD